MMKTVKRSISRFFILLVAGILTYGCAAPPLPDLIWPIPPDEPRIKYVKQLTDTESLKEKSAATELLIGSESAEPLKKPNGVFVDSTGKVYVTDTARSEIMKLDTVSKQGAIIGSRLLSKPIGVVADDKGRVFVADSDNKKVWIFTAEGNISDEFLKPDTPFKRPSGIAIDSILKLLYVTDTYDHHIRVFDLETLKQKSIIGWRGREDGLFNYPSFLTVAPNGNIVVSDTQNGRIQIFDSEGRFLRRFGEFGDAPGMFARPKGVAVDSEGHIYVVDAAFNNVQIFDDEGRILMAFSGYGVGRGEMILPAGIAIDKDDYIYVVDSWGRRVEVFEFLGDKHKAREAAKAAKKK
ncbi:MAG: hypothetical protein A3J24_05335 [Deltaproteobacteria bacterium RIFCSPLOWO2_02_FULL_53_8]|nr:MAG: hypothetical protein A3J24_05335 [Deltaproteobacteria bacterium RIFCSPLOWO2_02_FULL_53_8]